MHDQKGEPANLAWQILFAMCLLVAGLLLACIGLGARFLLGLDARWVNICWSTAGWLTLAGIGSIIALCCWQRLSETNYRFRLRTLFILTVLLALPFAWMAFERAVERERREAYIDHLLAQLDADDYQVSIGAAEALGDMGTELKGHPAVPKMLLHLPGNWDALTFRLIVALSEIGDKRALDTLRPMLEPKDVDVPGKIRATLQFAIDELER